MKKLIIGFLAFASISSFASDCIIHLTSEEMGEYFPSMEVLAKKIGKKMKSTGAEVVKNHLDANVGLILRYALIQETSTVKNGPYGDKKQTMVKYGIKATEYREGKLLSTQTYSTVDPEELASKILKDINCD